MIKLKFYGSISVVLFLLSACMLIILTDLITIDIIIISALSIFLFLATYLFLIKNVFLTPKNIKLGSDEFIIGKAVASQKINALFNQLGILYKTNRSYIFIKLPALQKKETRFYFNEINKIDFFNNPWEKARLELSSSNKKVVFYVEDKI